MAGEITDGRQNGPESSAIRASSSHLAGSAHRWMLRSRMQVEFADLSLHP
ncbi:hypothetical protein JOF42_000696 [Microbacterium phyllosphaerae]|uniref:Uncharacterized protein n=1 Tax=Microbacterium phyllosphaerae TaxID=124798 RepID=A0ABS4WME3_9MICO|nr:hypothetical protein [Microbacterium phyllosphaerae]